MIDTDDWIEASQEKSVREIFAERGEPGFRDLEVQAIAQVSSFGDPVVIALGGGAILRSENQQVIRQTGRRVWLDASAEYLYERICADSNTGARRPNLTDQGGFAEVAEVLAKRRPLYRELSELTVDTMGKSPDQVSREVYHWLQSQGLAH
jgi:shikimate kinase